MIYFDNAASGGFKPDEVYTKTVFALKNLLANPGRSGHGPSLEGEALLFSTRKKLSKYLNNGHIGRLVFTDGCTTALNFAIFGAPLSGDEIVTTVTEHNSVLRPLFALQRNKNIKIRFADLNDRGFVDGESVLKLVNDKTALIVMNAVSNVTGARNEFEKVSNAVGGRIPVIIDGAQLGGHERPDLKANNISAMALAGHKGLFAYQGVGVLAFTESFDPSPVLFGGSGGDTFLSVPTEYPEKLEAGTRNLISIASLSAGIDFATKNLEQNGKRLLRLTERLIVGLSKINGVRLYSVPNIYGIVAFEISSIPSPDAANLLWNSFQIAVRGGFHCAPYMHKALKTADNGLIRASLSPFNNENEVDAFVYAVKKITSDLL